MPFLAHVTLSFNKTLRFASPKTHVSPAPTHTHTQLVHWFSFSKTPHSLSCLLLLQPNAISGGYSIKGDQSPDSFWRPDCNPDIDYGTTFTLYLLLRLVAQPRFSFYYFLSLRNLDKLKLYHISCFAIQTASPLFLFYTFFFFFGMRILSITS